MTRCFALAALVCGTLVLAAPARAQTAGDCTLGTAQADLDFSDVQARVFNTGSLFLGNASQAAYLVPRASGKSPIYAAGLWLGGTINGTLRIAGATYRDFEFWPGPLNEGAVLPNPQSCADYDRIYLVSVVDVGDYEATGVAVPDLAEWPVGLGAPAVDSKGQPVVPSSREQTIDLEAGERPVLSGSQTAFWVMNDVGNDHENTGGGLLGVEVAVTAFSIASETPAFDQTTVYRYRITNRNSQTIHGFVAGFFADPDLGDASDDYIGVDVDRGLGFVYNADDSDAGPSGYGVPPAFGVDFLSGNFGTHAYFTNSNTGDPQTDPQDAEGYYNFLQGLWGDGTPLTAFGDGYQTGGQVTTFAFPGDPVADEFWSEVNLDGAGSSNAPADRRNLLATAPRTFAPGEVVQFDLGMVFAQGADRFASISALRAVSDVVQAAYDDGSLFAPADVSLALAQPQLVSPEDGAMFEDEDVTLVWQSVQFADEYLLSVEAGGDVVVAPIVEGTSFVVAKELFPTGTQSLISWSVRARGDDNGATVLSPLSETRTFSVDREPLPDFLALGAGIVEVARPSGAVCPDGSDDEGCALGLGNTVWLDADASEDYRITTDTDEGLERIRRYVASLAPFAVEIRFTDGAQYGLEFEISSSSEVWSVPFEIWNIGTTPDDPSDDIRMIPLLISEPGETEFDWANSFPREDPLLAGVSATSRVYAFMPDRPEGYALFAATAQASGVGNAYIDTDNTDTTIDNANLGIGDVDPTTGELCENRGNYVSYCYRNDQTSPVEGADDAGSTLVWPIGRIVFSDLAGDGTTPPAGTVVRFNTTDVDTFVIVDGEEQVETDGISRLLAPRPNPSRGSVEVPFELAVAGAARLTVVDALGREVARLVDGEVAAGVQRATLDGRALAAGVYVLVLETGGERLTRTLTVLR